MYIASLEVLYDLSVCILTVRTPVYARNGKGRDFSDATARATGRRATSREKKKSRDAVLRVDRAPSRFA